MGMLSALAAEHPQVVETFSLASDVLGYDLWKLVQEGPAEQLNIATYTQPAMFVSGVAVYRVFRALAAPEPIAVAGHSLGEYTALAAAGVLDPAEAIWLVRERGRLMQEECEQRHGTMAAILGLPEDMVEKVCRETGAQIANINSPTNFAGMTGTLLPEPGLVLLRSAALVALAALAARRRSVSDRQPV